VAATKRWRSNAATRNIMRRMAACAQRMALASFSAPLIKPYFADAQRGTAPAALNSTTWRAIAILPLPCLAQFCPSLASLTASAAATFA